MNTLAAEITNMLFSRNSPAMIVAVLKRRGIDAQTIAKAMLEARIDPAEVAKETGLHQEWVFAQSRKIQSGW
jgi:hypothetical protein